MSVNLTNFVDIKINHNITTTVSGTRDTAVLLHFTKSLGSKTTVIYQASTDRTSVVGDLKNFLDIFFANGGKKVAVVPVLKTTTTFTTDVITTGVSFQKLIDSFPLEYIMFSFLDEDSTAPFVEADFRALVNDLVLDGIHKKLFVVNVLVGGLTAISGVTKINLENYIVKIGPAGTAATILAYLTKILVYNGDSCQDYAFTIENIPTALEATFVTEDNAVVEAVIANNYNIDTMLVGKIRVVGGNDSAGFAIVNQFMLIVLHQTLTYRLIDLLGSKIKYNEVGLKSMLGTLSQELSKFVINGFLATNKTWTENDLYYKDYLIIEQNVSLVGGFKIAILPFSSLTPEQILARQFPPIYILIADGYFIRKIAISGKVF